ADALKNQVDVVQDAIQRVQTMVTKLAASDVKVQQAHIRRMVDDFAYIAQAALMMSEAQWELENGLPTDKVDIVVYFVNRHLRRDYEALDDADFVPRLERLT